MKKAMKTLCLAVIFVLFLNSCTANPASSFSSQEAPSSSAPVPPKTVLVLGLSGAEASLNYRWAELFRDEVNKLSNGSLQISLYGNGVLGSDLEVSRDCQYGTVDIQIASAGSLYTILPVLSVFDIPFLFKDLASARAALQQPLLQEELASAFTQNGMVLLGITDQGFRNLSLSVPISSLQDFSSITIRCMYNQNHTSFWYSLGFETVSMDIADVYLALQKGGVQAEENTYDQIYTNKFYELQKYMTDSQHLLDVKLIIFSKISWDSLSLSEQQILQEAERSCRDKFAAIVDSANSQALKAMQHEGIKLIPFDSIPGLREQCRTLAQPAALLAMQDQLDPTLASLWIPNES